jgi:hypothetical protein
VAFKQQQLLICTCIKQAYAAAVGASCQQVAVHRAEAQAADDACMTAPNKGSSEIMARLTSQWSFRPTIKPAVAIFSWRIRFAHGRTYTLLNTPRVAQSLHTIRLLICQCHMQQNRRTQGTAAKPHQVAEVVPPTCHAAFLPLFVRCNSPALPSRPAYIKHTQGFVVPCHQLCTIRAECNAGCCCYFVSVVISPVAGS